MTALDHYDVSYLASSLSVVQLRHEIHSAEVKRSVAEAYQDPFAGSGSTVFACFGFGRNSILVEPEPQYSGLIQSVAKKEFNYHVILGGKDGKLD